MDEAKLADLNDIQDFFNGASPTEKPHSNPIDVKDFIGWCNEPCDYYPKSSMSDQAYRLGKTICALEELSDDKIDEIKEILEAVAISVIGDINVTSKEQKDKLLDKARSDLLKYDEIRSKLEKHLGVYQGGLSKTNKKDLPENVAFYCALKFRLKKCPDEQGYYHYRFDDNGNTIARVDPLKPFIDSTHDNINQQWHVLISLLAYLDVAHALSCERHQYHCLYPYLSSYDIDDKGDFKKRRLRLGWKKVRGKYCRALEVVKINQDNAFTKRIGTPYPSGAMMDWIEKTLTGKLTDENPK